MARIAAKATATTVNAMDVVEEIVVSIGKGFSTVGSVFTLANEEVEYLIDGRREAREVNRVVRREELSTEFTSRMLEARVELAQLYEEHPDAHEDLNSFRDQFKELMSKFDT